jgi:hypothetical protein
MTDISKREPSLEGAPRPAPSFIPSMAASPPPTSAPQATTNSSLSDRGGLDQLSRIEEKSARIEEKFARTEALLLRVETTFQDALSKFGGLARTADVNALETRVRGLPGIGAIFFVALISAVIGAACVLAAQKYGIPGFLPPR